MRGLIGILLTAAFAAAAPAAGAQGVEGRAGLRLAVEAGGAVSASGRLPEGLSRAELAGLLPGARLEGDLSPAAPGDADGWRRALEALQVALPRIARAEIVLRDGLLRIEGRLQEGFALRETRPALRAALGPGWRLEAALAEAPPPAGASFAIGEESLRLEGMLPAGLSARQALATAGDGAEGALATGGRGNSAEWSEALGALGRLARLYERAEGRIGMAALAVDGRLAPGQDPDEIASWLADTLGEGWQIEVSGEARAAGPGARRVSPRTGETERLAHGRWLPVLSFASDAETCERRMAAAQRGRRLVFRSGRAELAEGGARLLDRLAAIAHVCLRGTGLALEIGGHTDSRGEPERNRALSDARAAAIRDALAARGVPGAAMEARGYGASRPVAPNDTEEGRRRNRRISFAWAPG